MVLRYTDFLSEMVIKKTTYGLKVPSGFRLVKSPTRSRAEGEEHNDVIPRYAERVRDMKMTWYDGKHYYHVFKDHRV